MILLKRNVGFELILFFPNKCIYKHFCEIQYNKISVKCNNSQTNCLKIGYECNKEEVYQFKEKGETKMCDENNGQNENRYFCFV